MPLHKLNGEFAGSCLVAYQEHSGVKETIMQLLHRTYPHLDEPEGSVSYVSWLSQCLQHHTACTAGRQSQVYAVGCSTCDLNVLTNKPQYVRLGSSLSGTMLSSTETLQGNPCTYGEYMQTTDRKAPISRQVRLQNPLAERANHCTNMPPQSDLKRTILDSQI